MIDIKEECVVLLVGGQATKQPVQDALPQEGQDLPRSRRVREHERELWQPHTVSDCVIRERLLFWGAVLVRLHRKQHSSVTQNCRVVTCSE
jgi:hypothetical protein